MKKTAIVTGGSRGIGLAIAKQLAKDGFNLAILATQDPEIHQKSLEQLRELGTEVLYVKGNVGDAADRERLVSETVKAFGAIHVLVNNAGVGPKVRNDLLDMTEESWDFVMGINTKGNMFLTQAVARQMLKQEVVGKKRGAIVNVSSCSAEVSSISRGEYCVSKAGVSMLTTLFADRLAPEGILVNEVRPGVIATDMTSAVKEKYDALIQAGAFPIARWGTPEDVAGAVSALVSDQFLYTTGNHIDVDGGFHIKRL
ncbi:MAG: 3-ketoacyl-ACP reductase [Candidatus Limiplasma sp.]|nr:3-ketoacyl-ACP reductase [Candidatus Limiplasma sp.]